MAIGDMLSLKTSMASRLIRCLYLLALILIAVMVVLGVARGVRIMSFTPPPPPTAAAAPPSADATAQPPAPQAMQRGPNNRMGMRRLGMRRPGMMGPRAPFGMGRNPTVAGLFAIFMVLLHGIIVLMVVRILAEMGLAVLAMPRRTET